MHWLVHGRGVDNPLKIKRFTSSDDTIYAYYGYSDSVRCDCMMSNSKRFKTVSYS